ncbi:MAG TPA: hypothetical protein VEI95_10185 [Acidobacteriota bacterium]|nr:hypothetical protein [Acidobacteriota bacterium]
MMCRFLCADFELKVSCPVDKRRHNVRFQAYPQLRDHRLDVVSCDAAPSVELLSCGKNCLALLESTHYWQNIYPESAVYTQSQ